MNLKKVAAIFSLGLALTVSYGFEHNAKAASAAEN